MNKKTYLAAFAALSIVSSTAVAAPKPVELTPAELTTAQTRTYQAPSSVAFSSTLSALQSLGYVDIDASKDAGTISAQTEAKGKIFYNILWGFGKKKLTQKASLLIEDNGTGQSTVRLNLHITETKARGIFGTSFSDGKLVKVADPYREFFTVLDAEIARRGSAAPAPVAPVPAQAPEPVAATPAAAQ